MTVVIVLISASILVAGGFLFAFLWAVRSGQYEDKYTPSVRMLLDEDEKTEIKEENKIIKNKNKGRQNEQI
jgi:cbb3-type cytochrome oxidase maturation protein